MKLTLFVRNMLLRIILGTGLLLVSLSVMSQDLRFQVWTDFNARFQFKNKLQLNVEPGYRIEGESAMQTAYFRATLRYTPTRIIALDAGVANFNVWSTDIPNSVELRTFQFVFLNWPDILDFSLKFRIGLEQRWFYFPEINTREYFNRFRFRVGLVSPYFDFWQGASKLYITSNFEILRKVSREFFLFEELVNENRFMLGLGFLDNKNFRGEFQCQLIGHREGSFTELQRDVNMIRLRVFYYFRKV